MIKWSKNTMSHPKHQLKVNNILPLYRSTFKQKHVNNIQFNASIHTFYMSIRCMVIE